jgi:hypothetical protein
MPFRFVGTIKSHKSSHNGSEFLTFKIPGKSSESRSHNGSTTCDNPPIDSWTFSPDFGAIVVRISYERLLESGETVPVPDILDLEVVFHYATLGS